MKGFKKNEGYIYIYIHTHICTLYVKSNVTFILIYGRLHHNRCDLDPAYCNLSQ